MTALIYDSDWRRKGTREVTLTEARTLIKASGGLPIYILSDDGKLLYSANVTGRVLGMAQSEFL